MNKEEKLRYLERVKELKRQMIELEGGLTYICPQSSLPPLTGHTHNGDHVITNSGPVESQLNIIANYLDMTNKRINCIYRILDTLLENIINDKED